MGPSRMLLSKPVVAAVEGHAVAGGLELAMWCDLRVAARDAVFGVYCRRWGVPLIDGGTIRLARMIGQSHALDLILTGRGVSGEEAVRMSPTASSSPAPRRGGGQTRAGPLPALLRSDRLSSYEQWSLDLPTTCERDPPRMDARPGETGAGALRFAQGAGRHGASTNPIIDPPCVRRVVAAVGARTLRSRRPQVMGGPGAPIDMQPHGDWPQLVWSRQRQSSTHPSPPRRRYARVSPAGPVDAGCAPGSRAGSVAIEDLEARPPPSRAGTAQPPRAVAQSAFSTATCGAGKRPRSRRSGSFFESVRWRGGRRRRGERRVASPGIDHRARDLAGSRVRRADDNDLGDGARRAGPPARA